MPPRALRWPPAGPGIDGTQAPALGPHWSLESNLHRSRPPAPLRWSGRPEAPNLQRYPNVPPKSYLSELDPCGPSPAFHRSTTYDGKIRSGGTGCKLGLHYPLTCLHAISFYSSLQSLIWTQEPLR